jgi:hypothetical protein
MYDDIRFMYCGLLHYDTGQSCRRVKTFPKKALKTTSALKIETAACKF